MSSQPNPDVEAEQEELEEGTLLSHLVELRTRLVRIALAVGVTFVALVPFQQRIFIFVSEPLRQALEGEKLIATGIASGLLTPFKLTFFVALFAAMPVVLYQVWSFVAPGLYKKEKRFAIPLLGSSILLFYAGIAFAYFVVFPLLFNFFIKVTPENTQNLPDIAQYLDFITTIVLAFGIAFEVPIATVLLVMTGLTTPKKLASARPYVFLTAFVVGMLLTPPDFLSQTVLAVPVYLLYELGIFMSKLMASKSDQQAEEAQAAD